MVDGKKSAYLKTAEEIELIRKSSLLVGKTLAEVAKHIKPGVTTLELDKIAEEFIRSHGATPAFKGYGGFPFTLCTSLNDVVVHGLPNNTGLKDGDILSVDCGVLMNGFYGDSAYTFEVGEIKPEVRELLEVTKECLRRGIEQAVNGNRIGDISWAIQSYAESFKYGVVRELVGHGIGKELHEAPEIPNYGKRGSGMVLKTGLVIAIEPMINMGTKNVRQHTDGWTVSTADKKPAAHFEHTIVVGEYGAEVLSSFNEIEEAIGLKI